MTHLEQVLRGALAEYAARVSPRPALHLIQARTAAADGPAAAGTTHHNRRRRVMPTVDDAFIARLQAEHERETEHAKQRRTRITLIGGWLREHAAELPAGEFHRVIDDLSVAVQALVEAEQLAAKFAEVADTYKPAGEEHPYGYLNGHAAVFVLRNDATVTGQVLATPAGRVVIATGTEHPEELRAEQILHARLAEQTCVCDVHDQHTGCGPDCPCAEEEPGPDRTGTDAPGPVRTGADNGGHAWTPLANQSDLTWLRELIHSRVRISWTAGGHAEGLMTGVIGAGRVITGVILRDDNGTELYPDVPSIASIERVEAEATAPTDSPPPVWPADAATSSANGGDQ